MKWGGGYGGTSTALASRSNPTPADHIGKIFPTAPRGPELWGSKAHTPFVGRLTHTAIQPVGMVGCGMGRGLQGHSLAKGGGGGGVKLDW